MYFFEIKKLFSLKKMIANDFAIYQAQFYKWQAKCTAIAIQNLMADPKRKFVAAISYVANEVEEKKRKVWVSPLCKLRPLHGFYEAIFTTLQTMDVEFLNYFRIDVQKFESLLAMIGPKITKKNSVRQSVSAEERLCLTLR